MLTDQLLAGGGIAVSAVLYGFQVVCDSVVVDRPPCITTTDRLSKTLPVSV